MTGSRDLWISAAIHKAYVDVNEEGTEAAAATGIVMRSNAMAFEERPAIFRADHPFLFFIRDTRSGGILFMGRVEDADEVIIAILQEPELRCLEAFVDGRGDGARSKNET